MKQLATLITCHNRREKTLACLKALYQAQLPEGYTFEVFLVDDGSTDGTGEMVKQQYPNVNVIPGTGLLYWNRGMHLAWQTAAGHAHYDFYLWLNDDTLLDNQALEELLGCYNKTLNEQGTPAIIVGSCRNSIEGNEFSYGGRTELGPVIPNGKLQACRYINGNAVLVPKAIFNALGNLSLDYTHAMGDFDYGLRALQKGFGLLVTPSFIATCPVNPHASWSDANLPFKKRWQLFHSPKGLNIKEYIKFRKTFWGPKWVIFALKAYVKVFFPALFKHK